MTAIKRGGMTQNESCHSIAISAAESSIITAFTKLSFFHLKSEKKIR